MSAEPTVVLFTGVSSAISMTAIRTYPGYLTDPALRTGGRLKDEPEDFVVEEIPAYEPCGEGEHLYLWVEKRDVSADALQSHLSRQFGCSRNDIGMAGLKDRRAVTRQWVSAPAKCESRVCAVETENIHLLRCDRHRNKLRTGHLKGNQFEIRLRECDAGGHNAATAIAEQIARRGVPNLYGDQRFGFDGGTLRLGLDLLTGAASPSSISPAKRKFLLRLALSAAQSALFNEVLARRLAEGRMHTVMAGDVMQVVRSGGPFVVEDAPTEQARFDQRETVITGPMFGPEMKSPAGPAAEFESQVLSDWSLTRAAFERFRNLTPGTRRPLLVWPENLDVHGDAYDLLIRFTLTPGAYATSVLREFLKPG